MEFRNNCTASAVAFTPPALELTVELSTSQLELFLQAMLLDIHSAHHVTNSWRSQNFDSVLATVGYGFCYCCSTATSRYMSVRLHMLQSHTMSTTFLRETCISLLVKLLDLEHSLRGVEPVEQPVFVVQEFCTVLDKIVSWVIRWKSTPCNEMGPCFGWNERLFYGKLIRVLCSKILFKCVFVWTAQFVDSDLRKKLCPLDLDWSSIFWSQNQILVMLVTTLCNVLGCFSVQRITYAGHYFCTVPYSFDCDVRRVHALSRLESRCSYDAFQTRRTFLTS